MKKKDLNSINAGVMMLTADADSCIVPGDKVRQRELREAARYLDSVPALIDALREIVRAEWTTVSLIDMTPQHRARLERARAALAKIDNQTS